MTKQNVAVVYGAYEKYQTEIANRAQKRVNCISFPCCVFNALRISKAMEMKFFFVEKRFAPNSLLTRNWSKYCFSSLKISLPYPGSKSFLSFGRRNQTRRKALTRNSFRSTSSRKRMRRGGNSSLSFGFIAIPILSPACLFFRHAPSATIDELAISNATIRNGKEM